MADSLVSYLEKLDSMRRQIGTLAYSRLTAGDAWRDARRRRRALSIEAFVLRYGHAYQWRRNPAGVRRGRPKQCFNNSAAYALARPDRFLYCEGYALDAKIAFPIHHAWLVPADGRLIAFDPTVPFDEYFGVAFSPGYLRSHWARPENDCASLIDNWLDRWPMLTADPGWLVRDVLARVAHPRGAAAFRKRNCGESGGTTCSQAPRADGGRTGRRAGGNRKKIRRRA